MGNDGGAVRIFGVEMRLVEEQNDVVRADPDLIAHMVPDSAGDGVADEEGLDSFPLVRVDEGGEQDKFVKTGFVKAMSGAGLQSAAERVYKNVHRGVTWQTKLRSFGELTTNKQGLRINKVKYTWFGGSKEEISNVLRYGFASRGSGISLSPFGNPTVSLRDCVADEDGLYHMMLCRAILGKPELLRPGAAQRFATSEDSYAGVDNLESPSVYTVWSSYINTHVMPMYVVSFKPPVKAGQGPASASARAPVAVNPVDPIRANKAAQGPANASDRAPVAVNPVRANEGAAIRRDPFIMVMAKLIDELALVLPASAITRLRKLNGDLEERNITNAAMTQELRQLAGDDVLRMATDSIKNLIANEVPVSGSARAPVAVNPVDPVRANEGAAPITEPVSDLLIRNVDKLILEAASVLPASTITRLQKVNGDYRERKITKKEMKQQLRQIGGADVLITAFRSLKQKRVINNSNNNVNGARRAAARSSARKVVKKLRGAASP